jgi:hypothetical protein
MARQWLKCAISWSATVVREYRLSPAGPRCAAGCRFSTTTSTTRPGPSPRVSLRLSWASAGLAGRQWGLLLGPVLIILGHVAWLGSCAFAVVRAARKAPNNDLGRICSGSRFFDRRLPGLYAGACHLGRRSRRDRVASFWRRAVACFLPGPRHPDCPWRVGGRAGWRTSAS